MSLHSLKICVHQRYIYLYIDSDVHASHIGHNQGIEAPGFMNFTI